MMLDWRPGRGSNRRQHLRQGRKIHTPAPDCFSTESPPHRHRPCQGPWLRGDRARHHAGRAEGFQQCFLPEAAEGRRSRRPAHTDLKLARSPKH
jgi:hypothetical protein